MRPRLRNGERARCSGEANGGVEQLTFRKRDCETSCEGVSCRNRIDCLNLECRDMPVAAGVRVNNTLFAEFDDGDPDAA